MGLGAARRVRDAIERGEPAPADDAITMNLYQLSLELRRIPPEKRLKQAHKVARWLIANTRESLD